MSPLFSFILNCGRDVEGLGIQSHQRYYIPLLTVERPLPTGCIHPAGTGAGGAGHGRQDSDIRQIRLKTAIITCCLSCWSCDSQSGNGPFTTSPAWVIPALRRMLVKQTCCSRQSVILLHWSRCFTGQGAYLAQYRAHRKAPSKVLWLRRCNPVLRRSLSQG
jgi:hypothetical protein